MIRQIHSTPINSEFHRVSSIDFDQTKSHTSNHSQQRTEFYHRASQLTRQSFRPTTTTETEPSRPTTQIRIPIRNVRAVTQAQKKSGFFKISNRTKARLNVGLSVLYGLAVIGIGVLGVASLLTPFPIGLVIGAMVFLLAAQTLHAGCWYEFDKRARHDQKMERRAQRAVAQQLNQTPRAHQQATRPHPENLETLQQVQAYYNPLAEEQMTQTTNPLKEAPSQIAHRMHKRKHRPLVAQTPTHEKLATNPNLGILNWTSMKQPHSKVQQPDFREALNRLDLAGQNG